MKFVEERKNKIVTMGAYSQSFGKVVESCKLKAWFTIRNRKKAYDMNSKPLQVGICVKDLFSKSVEKYSRKREPKESIFTIEKEDYDLLVSEDPAILNNIVFLEEKYGIVSAGYKDKDEAADKAENSLLVARFNLKADGLSIPRKKSIEIKNDIIERYAEKENSDEKSRKFSASVRYEAHMLSKRVSVSRFVKNPGEICAYSETLRHTMRNGIELVGLFDLLLLKEDERGAYLEVINITTSHKLTEENNDLQSLIAAYLTANTYGMNVNFVRYSCRTGEQKSEFYYHKNAIAIGKILEDASSDARKVVEGEDKPRPSASPRCLECPFLDECSVKGTKIINTEDLMNEYLWASAKAKKAETALKEQREFSEEDIVMNGMKIEVRESRRRTIKNGNKKLSKKDLISLILSDGTAPDFIDNLDIEYSDQVLNKIEELGLTIDVGITSKIALVENKE